jgi:hypothetical protein
MDDFFSQLKAAAGEQPSATLLRQIRAVPSVREAGKHRFAVAPGITLELRLHEGAWRGHLDKHGRNEVFVLASATDERKLIDAIKRTAAGRDDE